MAEINQNNNERSSRVRVKRMSTKIDMTPMVDLAFLLLTFFILTSTFSRFNTMELTMPDNTGEPQPINDENVLNLVLGENDTIYWWNGVAAPPNVTNFSSAGVRKLLLSQVTSNPNVMVLIKPKDESRYENMVDILDEMEITNITRYAIVKYTDNDQYAMELTDNK